jgi:ADP-heptose:LPS heptosyltransferase
MRLLVIRTSAMGDVALTTPVLRALRQQYPEVELVLLTRPSFKPFFYSFNGLTLFFTDLKKKHKGLPGLIRLFMDLYRSDRYDIVIDLHDVLRSRILRLLFSLKGVPSFIIDKGRSEKRRIISGKKKAQLKHSVVRYIETFARAGFPLTFIEGPWIIPSPKALSKIASLTGSADALKIGVAPWARHKLKVWPEEHMIRLLEMISENHKAIFFFFGGNEEKEQLSAFEARIEGSLNTNGILDLDEELALMSKLDLMIAMDSSNMHMAALTGTKVISVWGGTDPISGFGAWMQPEDHSIRIPIDELSCRPCTIYGKGECIRGDFACMNWLRPEIVFRKMDSILVRIAEDKSTSGRK